MVDVIKQTPIEYSNQSRDYQVIARLYTALFNMVKMYIDSLGVWDTDIDDRLSFHRAVTLNFRTRHNWDLDDLEAVTTCFKYLMKNKGAKVALEYCINILMKIEGVTTDYIEDLVNIENYIVTIKIPEDVLTLGIVEDLVDYLLPIGLLYNIYTFKYEYLGSDYLTPTELYAITEKEDIKTQNVLFTPKMYVGYDGSGESNIITDTFIYNVKEFDA